jgi:hypothetical protein
MELKKINGIVFFLIFFNISFINGQARKNTRPLDIYYIAIGSGHYNHDFNAYTKEFTGFDDVVPATNSASAFAQLMDSCNVGYGMTLVSNDTMRLTRTQIIDSTSSLIAIALNNIAVKNNDGLFVFYYCGHGIKADSSNDLFLVPGDFKCSNVKRYDQLSSNALSINNLFEESLLNVPGKLSYLLRNKNDFEKIKSRLSFSLLLDCCYNVAKVNNEVIDNLIALQGITFSLGGLEVTKLADGLAKFLVTRTKQEMNDRAIYQSFVSPPGEGLVTAKNLTDHPLFIHYAVSPGAYAQIVYTSDNSAFSKIETGPLCYKFINLFYSKSSFSYFDFSQTMSGNNMPESDLDKYSKRILKRPIKK